MKRNLTLFIALLICCTSMTQCGASQEAEVNAKTKKADVKKKPMSTVATAQTYTLKVDGMHCSKCVSAINKGITSIEGVEKIDVNLESKQAIVKVKAGGPTQQQVTDTITKLGYKCEEVNAEDKTDNS